MFQFRFVAIATVAVFLTASSFGATKYAVGTCLPNLPFFPTISAAVSAVPSGSTIEVCPGNYAEQVLITQPLTLEGVPGAASDAVIVAPAGGLTQSISFDFLGTVSYQVLVQSTGPVTITNLAVDGSGGTGGGYIAGIVYQNSSGTLNRMSIRNQLSGGLGVGVLAFTSQSTAQTVTVENSVVRSFDGVGVWAITGDAGFGLLTADITSNTINGSGATNNVGVAFSNANGKAQSNQISGSNYGVSLFPSAATVTSNTISAKTIGVDIYSGSATVTSNKIDAGSFYGLYLAGTATNSVLQHNTIGNSLNAVFGCDVGSNLGNAAGFTVTSNTITDAAIGVEMPSSGNTTTPNSYYATAAAVQGCPSFGKHAAR